MDDSPMKYLVYVTLDNDFIFFCHHLQSDQGAYPKQGRIVSVVTQRVVLYDNLELWA